MTRVYNFLKVRFIVSSISVLCIVVCLIATAVQGGFNLGTDFSAGLNIQVAIAPDKAKAPIEELRRAMKSVEGAQIQSMGDQARQQYSIRTKQQGEDREYSEKTKAAVLLNLEKAFGAGNVKTLQTDYVGPRFSSDLASQTAFLTLFALALIMLYAWLRFKLSFAFAAIVATLHDAFFMIGVVGAFQMEVSTTTVAAVLTIIGYSINDTIVIFDRIRENEILMRDSRLPHIINASVTQTLSRTIATSFTTLIAILALYFLASGDVQAFAFNMIIGITVGTYSSIFIASPVMLGWRNAAVRFNKKREQKKFGAISPAKPSVEPSVEPSQASSDDAEVEANEAADAEPETVQSSVQIRHKVKQSREKRKRQTGN
jgi:preprotein translocase subunit SecF